MSDIVVNLPSSGKPPYPESYWGLVEAELRSLMNENEAALTFEKLEQVILGFTNQRKYCNVVS